LFPDGTTHRHLNVHQTSTEHRNDQSIMLWTAPVTALRLLAAVSTERPRDGRGFACSE